MQPDVVAHGGQCFVKTSGTNSCRCEKHGCPTSPPLMQAKMILQIFQELFKYFVNNIVLARDPPPPLPYASQKNIQNT